MVNSFIFTHHIDAEAWQRRFRASLPLRFGTIPPPFTWTESARRECQIQFSTGTHACGGGFGSVYLCSRCKQPCLLDILHEAGISPFLKISPHKANCWIHGKPAGFDLQIVEGARIVDHSADEGEFRCGGCF